MKTVNYYGLTCKVVPYETRNGKALSDWCENWEGNTLHEVYGNPTETAIRNYEKLMRVYDADPYADTYGIVFHDYFNFWLSWFSTFEGHDVALLISGDNNYMVVYPE